MAFPIILVSSATGSDSNTSGAGPGTALTGTAASSTTTTNIDITDTVDLSGVATDGSAAIYFNDTTAGHRRFAQITNVTGGPSGSTWHITVDSTGVTSGVGPVSWAIGGVRASIGGATSALLFNNNSAAGDALPGWTVQMQSAHSETISATFFLRRSGNTTSGRITLQGAPGAGTLPLLTFSNNGTGLNLTTAPANYITLAGFELQNSNATKTASVAIDAGGTNLCSASIISGIKIANSTNKFWRGVLLPIKSVIKDCEVGYCASYLLDASHTSFGDGGLVVLNNYLHDGGTDGLLTGAGNSQTWTILDNIFYNNAGCGINWTGNSSNKNNVIKNNTIHLNTSDGIKIAGDGTSLDAMVIANNILSNNSGNGLNFAADSDANILGHGVTVLNNDTYSNTGNAYKSTTAGYANNTCPWASGDPGLNPTYMNAAGGDFSIGTNLRAQGYPLGGTLHIGTTSSTYSYIDIGAAQHQDTGGSSAPFGGATFVDLYW